MHELSITAHWRASNRYLLCLCFHDFSLQCKSTVCAKTQRITVNELSVVLNSNTVKIQHSTLPLGGIQYQDSIMLQSCTRMHQCCYVKQRPLCFANISEGILAQRDSFPCVSRDLTLMGQQQFKYGKINFMVSTPR